MCTRQQAYIGWSGNVDLRVSELADVPNHAQGRARTGTTDPARMQRPGPVPRSPPFPPRPRIMTMPSSAGSAWRTMS